MTGLFCIVAGGLFFFPREFPSVRNCADFEGGNLYYITQALWARLERHGGPFVMKNHPLGVQSKGQQNTPKPRGAANGSSDGCTLAAPQGHGRAHCQHPFLAVGVVGRLLSPSSRSSCSSTTIGRESPLKVVFPVILAYPRALMQSAGNIPFLLGKRPARNPPFMLGSRPLCPARLASRASQPKTFSRSFRGLHIYIYMYIYI